MSMEYKAFTFDYDAFMGELAPILFEALEHDQTEGLRSFIDTNFAVLQHPYYGGLLEASWQTEFVQNSVDCLGDVALTKYYDRANDGLFIDGWHRFAEQLDKIDDVLIDLTLGRSFGPARNRFDPGKMGSYFLSPADVKANFIIIQDLFAKKKDQINPKYPDDFKTQLKVFQKALAANKGIYTTF